MSENSKKCPSNFISQSLWNLQIVCFDRAPVPNINISNLERHITQKSCICSHLGSWNQQIFGILDFYLPLSRSQTTPLSLNSLLKTPVPAFFFPSTLISTVLCINLLLLLLLDSEWQLYSLIRHHAPKLCCN